MFLKLKDSTDWMLYEDDGFLSNIRGEGSYVRKDSPEWNEAVIDESISWYELCKKYSYYPTETTYRSRDVWLSPDGRFFEGRCHAVEAEYICEYMFNKHVSIHAWDTWDDFLIDEGWVKLTTTLMYSCYIENGMYKNLTDEQKKSARIWAYQHRMPAPA